MVNVIDPSAQIAPDVKLGLGVRIYPNVIIESGCEIGDFCVIGHPTKIPSFQGKNLKIGAGSLIRSHAVLYEGSALGQGLETGHHVVIREGTQTGINLRVGNFSDIEGDCIIGDYCRFHGYVHVGRGSKVGNFVWLFSLVTLTNDPLPPSRIAAPVIIEDGVVVAVNVTVMPGTWLKRGSFVSSGGSVSGTVQPAAVVKNDKVICGVNKLMNLKHSLRHPWMQHLNDAYPEHIRSTLIELGEKIKHDSNSVIIKSKN